MSTACGLVLLGIPLAACSDHSNVPAERATLVKTALVQPHDRRSAVSLTGEVQARFNADLSFRVSGRVIARLADVGTHVNAGDLLARLDPAEQQADFDAAAAALAAAEAQLRVAQATFDRQSSLLSSGFTTRVAYDNALEQLRTAHSTLDFAKAELGRAREGLGDTELRARAAGVITARSLEIGQVVQAAQPVFTLAQDGERDAVFDVPETIFFGEVDHASVSLSLVSDSGVAGAGSVREISPAVNPKSSTVRVKVAIENPPAEMSLGSAVTGTVAVKAAAEIAVPWTALSASGSKPAVWVVDPKTRTAWLKPVTVGGYEARSVQITEGLNPGDRVVTDGGKLLSSGEPVTYSEGES
jgi:membrane fusion protein, multidrug efflux system